MKKDKRWYHDKKIRLPTIRRHPDARTYQTPDEVKQMVSSQEPNPYDYPIQGSCEKCGGPLDPLGLCERENE